MSGSAPNQSPANEDPSKWRVVHKKPHPLAKCCAFRSKPLDERRSLLRQHGVCLRCVATCTHFAKDYKASVQCAECQSERHITALHAGPPSKLDTLDSEQHGGELNSVTTRCTDVCGNMAGGKFCSKICLANIYIEGCPETKIKAYVVIDDQSNRSLMKSKLLDLLKLEGEPASYTLKTCSGTSQAKERLAQGLVIESLERWRVRQRKT